MRLTITTIRRSSVSWRWAVLDWLGAEMETGHARHKHKAHAAAVRARKKLMKQEEPI